MLPVRSGQISFVLRKSSCSLNDCRGTLKQWYGVTVWNIRWTESAETVSWTTFNSKWWISCLTSSWHSQTRLIIVGHCLMIISSGSSSPDNMSWVWCRFQQSCAWSWSGGWDFWELITILSILNEFPEYISTRQSSFFCLSGVLMISCLQLNF